jgi:integral membrane protein
VHVRRAEKPIFGDEMKNPVSTLRTLALIEGISFLILLFIAMPLKYMAGMPLAVRIVGMAHGILFVIFCCSLAHTWLVARWGPGRAALIFAASIIPFGPWLVDRRMKSYEAAFAAARANAPSAPTN